MDYPEQNPMTRPLSKKMRIVTLLIFAFSLGSSSCSGQLRKRKVENGVGSSVDQSESEERYTLDQASSRLKELAKEARSVGPHAVNYLASDLYLKASAASMRGDFQTAVILYKHLIDLVPQDRHLKSKYAIELIRVGKLDQSLGLLEEIFRESKQKDEKIGLILTGVYSAKEKRGKARRVYKLVLKNHPKNEDACIFLAKTHVLENNYQKAHSVLANCEKKISKNGIFSYYRGKLYLDKEQITLAIKSFKRALRIDPDYHQAALAVGLIYEETKKYKKALGVYENYLKRDPGNTTILSRVVQVLFIQQKFVKVIPYMEKLVAEDPANLNLKVKLGILYTDAKMYGKTKKTFKELLVQLPESDRILYYLGAVYQETLDYEDAVKYYSRINTSSSLYIDSSLQIAQILNLMALSHDENTSERVDKEKSLFSFIEDRSEKEQKLLVELAIVKASYFEATEKYDKSIKIMREISTKKEFNEGHEYYLATLLEKNNEYPEAKRIMMEMVKKNPQNAHAWNFLGYSMMERGEDLKQAFKYISKAVNIRPDDGFIRDSMGWYYYKIGQYKKALKQLQKARQSVPNDGVITKHLAMAYQALKKYELAKKYYIEALKKSKAKSDKVDIQRALDGLKTNRLPASEPVRTQDPT